MLFVSMILSYKAMTLSCKVALKSNWRRGLLYGEQCKVEGSDLLVGDGVRCARLCEKLACVQVRSSVILDCG